MHDIKASTTRLLARTARMDNGLAILNLLIPPIVLGILGALAFRRTWHQFDVLADDIEEIAAERDLASLGLQRGRLIAEAAAQSSPAAATVRDQPPADTNS